MSALRRYLWHVVIIALASYICYNTNVLSIFSSLISPSPSKQTAAVRSEEHAKRKQIDIENAILKQGKKVVAETCSPNTNVCFLITDTAAREDERLVVRRSMILKDNPKYALTIVELEQPEVLTWSNFNTRNWPVNKLVIVSRYIKIMIAAGFFSEAITLEPLGSQNVLMIGLGGGVASNFLSMLDWLNIHTTVVELDPFVDSVASDWFDHREDERTEVLIEDGAAYVKRTAEEGKKKFHSIMLDACYNDQRPVLCPVKEFENPEIIQNMADLLEDKGVLIVYIICTRDTVAYEEQLLKTFEPFFNSCYLLKYLPERQILICSKRPNWTWKEQRSRFKQHLTTIDDTFEFQIGHFFKNH